MKVAAVGLTTMMVIAIFLLTPQGFLKSFGAQLGTAHQAVTQLSQSSDRLPALKARIVKRARKDQWWMLLVGLTVVAYRLRQHHRALFENSLLYASPEDFDMHLEPPTVSVMAPYEDVPERAARAT